MRLTRHQIEALSRAVAAELDKAGLTTPELPREKAVSVIEAAVTADLKVEDALDEEVKDILKAHQREIETGRADYKTMFDLVKKKLARERGLVL